LPAGDYYNILETTNYLLNDGFLGRFCNLANYQSHPEVFEGKEPAYKPTLFELETKGLILLFNHTSNNDLIICEAPLVSLLDTQIGVLPAREAADTLTRINYYNCVSSMLETSTLADVVKTPQFKSLFLLTV
jgi:hypothetical protein